MLLQTVLTLLVPSLTWLQHWPSGSRDQRRGGQQGIVPIEDHQGTVGSWLGSNLSGCWLFF